LSEHARSRGADIGPATFAGCRAKPISCVTDRGIIVEHGPPATFFTSARDPRTREFLSQIL
jgi:hypothetical protein